MVVGRKIITTARTSQPRTESTAMRAMKMKADDLQRNRKVSIQSRLNVKQKVIGNLKKSLPSSQVKSKEKICSVFDRLGFT